MACRAPRRGRSRCTRTIRAPCGPPWAVAGASTGAPMAAGGGGTGYSGMCGTRVAWDPYKPGQVFTLGDDEGKLERSQDYLWSWKLSGSPGLIGPYNGAADVTFAADGTIYVGSGQFGNHSGRYANEPIVKSSDGGGSWSYV